jgi:hypothetical protein
MTEQAESIHALMRERYGALDMVTKAQAKAEKLGYRNVEFPGRRERPRLSSCAATKGFRSGSQCLGGGLEQISNLNVS